MRLGGVERQEVVAHQVAEFGFEFGAIAHVDGDAIVIKAAISASAHRCSKAVVCSFKFIANNISALRGESVEVKKQNGSVQRFP